MKLVLNRRIRGRRVVLVLASRPLRRRPRAGAGRAAVAAAAAAAGAAYTLHRIGRRSGASSEEVRAPLPGDGLVTEPLWQSTRAITIDAPPDAVWPWIVQMGYPAYRAGWYTPHWLDRLQWDIHERSADRIIDELQTLSAGDRVPDSPDWSVFFTVAEMQPERALVLHSTRHLLRPMRAIDFSWAFALQPLGVDRTRFIVRARASYAPRWSWLVLGVPYLLGDFLNTSNILRAVKRRAEQAATAPSAASTADGRLKREQAHATAIVSETDQGRP